MENMLPEKKTLCSCKAALQTSPAAAAAEAAAVADVTPAWSCAPDAPTTGAETCGPVAGLGRRAKCLA